ncbi:MAG: GNAT family N-acetyltransferase [Legionella sp.]|nr:GNAT family N-acetyltransferase [Legionella sp.]
MILLENTNYQPVYELYLKESFFYPLIAAVLLQKQDGVVFVNDSANPTQIYVEHSFGFAQLFGVADNSFELKLEHYLFESKQFTPEKIRLYAPKAPEFILKPDYQSFQSQRQRFILDQKQLVLDTQIKDNINCVAVNEMNCATIDREFNVVSRFWRNSADFIKGSQAVVVIYKNKIASICYAAAEANHWAEIDVLTLPHFRNFGLGKHAVRGFIHRCAELSVTPVWDCFTNNMGSMALCNSVGFIAADRPYLFFTIPKG